MGKKDTYSPPASGAVIHGAPCKQYIHLKQIMKKNCRCLSSVLMAQAVPSKPPALCWYGNSLPDITSRATLQHFILVAYDCYFKTSEELSSLLLLPLLTFEVNLYILWLNHQVAPVPTAFPAGVLPSMRASMGSYIGSGWLFEMVHSREGWGQLQCRRAGWMLIGKYQGGEQGHRREVFSVSSTGLMGIKYLSVVSWDVPSGMAELLICRCKHWQNLWELTVGPSCLNATIFSFLFP